MRLCGYLQDDNGLDYSLMHYGHFSMIQLLLTNKASITTGADDILKYFFFFIYFREYVYKTFHVNYLLDNTHEMSSLFSLKNNNSKQELS